MLPLVLLLMPLLVLPPPVVDLQLLKPLKLVLLVAHSVLLDNVALNMVFVVPLVITVELDAKLALVHALPMD